MCIQRVHRQQARIQELKGRFILTKAGHSIGSARGHSKGYSAPAWAASAGGQQRKCRKSDTGPAIRAGLKGLLGGRQCGQPLGRKAFLEKPRTCAHDAENGRVAGPTFQPAGGVRPRAHVTWTARELEVSMPPGNDRCPKNGNSSATFSHRGVSRRTRIEGGMRSGPRRGNGRVLSGAPLPCRRSVYAAYQTLVSPLIPRPCRPQVRRPSHRLRIRRPEAPRPSSGNWECSVLSSGDAGDSWSTNRSSMPPTATALAPRNGQDSAFRLALESRAPSM